MANQGFPSNYEISITAQDGWDPLKVYCYYRALIAVFLFGVFLTPFGELFGSLYPDLYFETSSLYVVVAIISLIILIFYKARSKSLAFAIIILDIVFVSLLTYSSGGVTSNLSILMLVTVAAGGILLVGQVATLVAAVAALIVLAQQFYFTWILQVKLQNELLQTGLLGLAFFGTSLLAQQLAKRLRASELVASIQASDLADLQELNRLIIQRMYTGILVVNHKQRIRLVNESGWKMLGMPEKSTNSDLRSASPELQERLKAWQRNTEARSKPFRAHISGPELSANFAELSGGNTDDILIFLEDASHTARQAQHLKLASLGRLTAGIAHEIRNPLGAISHAAQLLNESDQLDSGDKRLADIIQQHSIRVNTIIENVLQLSRRKQPKPVLLNLKDWLLKFVTDYKIAMPTDYEIFLDVQPDNIQVSVDPVQLSQILTNLTDNALRHNKQATGKGQAIINGAVVENSQLPFIEVIDHGPGVDPAKVENIFEPFFTTENKGSGLGLFIARELCESNQARLDYVPVPTGGCCFRVTFALPDENPIKLQDDE